MIENVQAYPLHWPMGFPRSKTREEGRFRSSYDTARSNVVKSLKGFANDSGKQIADPILSSNVDLMGQVRGGDPGVAVWFTWDGLQVCIPVDRYRYAASNLQAIHHIIEARRVELRHGTLALVRASFTGFKALPAPPGGHWRDVLAMPSDMPATREDIEKAYRALAIVRHPDKGGTAEAMAALNAARAAALAEVGG